MIFEPWRDDEPLTVTGLSLHESAGRRRGRFSLGLGAGATGSLVSERPTGTQLLEIPRGSPAALPVHDFCPSLCIPDARFGQWENLGFISSQSDPSAQYMMRALKKLPNQNVEKPLRDSLPHLSRHDRLHIAAGLACCVMQFCGNWLKAWWDSANVHLVANSDEPRVSSDNVYLSWPISTSGTSESWASSSCSPRARYKLLRPLGIALVELSLGKSLATLCAPEDEDPDTRETQFNTASRLTTKVYSESGIHYGDAVTSCLSGSPRDWLCLQGGFDERIFNDIISPLLKDLVNFCNS